MIIKKNYEKLYTRETTSKAVTTKFLSKIHLIQMLIQMFSMQLVNMFYLLKDLKNHFFSENRKFSNKVL